ncbi:MAG: DUF4031 domain-containing protein [Actinobacteria bacterium]|nr:DUF4031 domain-containing protein [Actinomycetota bacterium]
MALLVDSPNWSWRERMWCHLVSDTSLDELHAFAARLGVPERGFQGDHYDIPTDLRSVAVALGAHEVTSRELVNALYACGLRQIPKRQNRHRPLIAHE